MIMRDILDFKKSILYITNNDDLLEKSINFIQTSIKVNNVIIFKVYGTSLVNISTNESFHIKDIFSGFTAISGEENIVVDTNKDYRFNLVLKPKFKILGTSPILNRKGDVSYVVEIQNNENIITNDTIDRLNIIISIIEQQLQKICFDINLHEEWMSHLYSIQNITHYKDNETSNHTIRVGKFASIIAEKLSLDSSFVKNIEITAPLHDIGKMGIPDSILKKPASLTSEEFTIMKKHPKIGFDILDNHNNNELSDMAKVISLEHHEKFDGSGYPYGLKGSEITLEARITSISDVYDALTSKRPYKEAWSDKEAIDFINSKKASDFDPNIVNIFNQNIEHIIKVKNSFLD
jgi:response regulator RpfG family c-di-GMP phosphodiesterase